MSWIEAAREFYTRNEVRVWIDGRCQSGDVRMWLPFIDDVLSKCNEVSRWYYTTMQRQYEDDLLEWDDEDLWTDTNPVTITFSLYPKCPQPSSYINFSTCIDPINMHFSSNDDVY